jgi:hypothetical protein
MFVHLVAGEGPPLAQADALGAPGALWRDGDLLFQHHTFTVPPGTPPGPYGLTVGVYQTDGGARLTTAGGQDALPLAEVVVE